VPDRSGISTLVLRTASLQEEQLLTLLRYRLGQLVHPAVNVINPRVVFAARMENEPLAHVLPDDVHFIAGSTETGAILCYAVLTGLGDLPPGTTLRVWERPLFPVERTHGWGIYNRLRVLPDLPLAKIRQLDRFVANRQQHGFDELGIRSPVEVGVAVYRTLVGPLRPEIEALIGDMEEEVARENLGFFHIPAVFLQDTIPYAAETSFYFPRYQHSTIYPFAAYGADISTATRSRLDAIEQGLSLPGKQGLLSLFALKRDLQAPRSSLEPSGGLPAPAAELPQRRVAMETRRQLLDMAHRLRQIDVFAGLTDAEASVLGSFIEPQEVAAGETVIRQGEIGDALYLVEGGEAEVRIRSLTGQPLAIATLGPGDHFGEIALVTGGRRTADVVAVTPMTVLRLSKDAFTRYLAQLVEVEQQITRGAARRASEAVQKMVSGEE
jgi:hypothetical protein